MTRRGADAHIPHSWEFPGGKIEPGETPEQALTREIREELTLDIDVGELLGRGTGAAGALHVILDVYAATIVGGELELVEHEECGWFLPQELHSLTWPEADLPIIPRVIAWLTGPSGA